METTPAAAAEIEEFKGACMDNHTYKFVELVGTSKTSVEDAVGNALASAAKTVTNMRWFQITETRGAIKDDKVSEWQVTVKVGCRLDV